jgi:cobalt/nickel transport system permease protein
MHHAYIDKFSYNDSPIHRLDARVKFVVLIVFTILVIALPRTSPAILACYAVGPFAVLVIAQIPLGYVLKHILLVSSFVLVLALTCPLYDRTIVTVSFGPLTWHSTAGWLRCWTILAKFVVTMLGLMALVSTTKFADLLAGLRKLGVPKILTIQLGFLYRYIFLLIDTAHKILLARAGRTLRKLPFRTELRTAAAMVGSLLVRSIDNAQNVSIAMQARGFDGNWRTISRLHIGRSDIVFIAVAAVFLALLQLIIKPFLL